MSDEIKTSDFLFYRGEDGKIHVQIILGDETVWITQRSMADIFGVDVRTISEHLQNIYTSGELSREATIRKIRKVQKEGNRDVSRDVDFHNLDVIIAIGYRVNSFKATKFRQWATRILKDYLIKGFVLDDERLKQGNKLFGKDYFKELLERIREIRASERMFYEKITDLYATSVDYDKNDPDTHKFFAKVQNKLEYAITGKTSAEIIRTRADATLPHMGLKTWKNVNRDGKILRTDVTIAKNYLNETELRKLNALVNMYLDYAELQVERHRIMKMEDWAKKLDEFLKFNEYPILDNAGKISKAIADSFADNEYLKFRVIQDEEYESDFDRVVDEIKHTNKLPTEEKISKKKDDEISKFDQNLKGLLNVPPPKKDK